MDAAVKNYLKLLNYFDKDCVKICLPEKNDFGEMSGSDFKKWHKKLLLIKETDQSQKILRLANGLIESKSLSKSLQKNLKFINEQT